MTLDQRMYEGVGLNLNALVFWYLIPSYFYYVEDKSLLSDPGFDWVCDKLLYHWEDVDHKLKYLIDKNSLEAGTGYYIDFKKIPGSVIRYARGLINESY